MLWGIQAELFSSARRLDEPEQVRFAYGARSEAAVYVGQLLTAGVPAVAAGELDIVAIARRPGVLSKVAIRPRAGGVMPLQVGIGADHIAAIRHQLDGERIHVVRWQRSAPRYIADALGLAEVPPVQLMPGFRRARLLLGEIDVRGIAGWRGLNVILASALTGWRVRLEAVAATVAWQRLTVAMLARRPVTATVIGRTERGLRVDVLGLYGLLTGQLLDLPPGRELAVRISRMNADEGRIFVSDRPLATDQLWLPLT